MQSVTLQGSAIWPALPQKLRPPKTIVPAWGRSSTTVNITPKKGVAFYSPADIFHGRIELRHACRHATLDEDLRA
jgi:hypothetical protein